MLIHNTTQNITLSLSCDQMLLSLDSLIGCSNCSMAILGLCAITIPIFPRGIFCQRHLPPTLEFPHRASDQFHSVLMIDMQVQQSQKSTKGITLGPGLDHLEVINPFHLTIVTSFTSFVVSKLVLNIILHDQCHSSAYMYFN